jgi:hypothetical protein
VRLVVPIDAHLQPPASKQQLMQQQGGRERGKGMQHPATSWKEAKPDANSQKCPALGHMSSMERPTRQGNKGESSRQVRKPAEERAEGASTRDGRGHNHSQTCSHGASRASNGKKARHRAHRAQWSVLPGGGKPATPSLAGASTTGRVCVYVVAVGGR